MRISNFRSQIKEKGFTLIEMVVVMAMIGIVSGVTLKLIRFSDVGRSLSMATAELKGVIRTAQTLALAPPMKEVGGKVVHICGFVVQKGSGDSELKIRYAYPSNGDLKECRFITNISDVCNGGTMPCEDYETKFFDGFEIGLPSDIFFRTPYGKVVGGPVTITINQVGSIYIKSITINKLGKINTN